MAIQFFHRMVSSDFQSDTYIITAQNTTHNPMSSNSHPSAIVNKTHTCSYGGVTTKYIGVDALTVSVLIFQLSPSGHDLVHESISLSHIVSLSHLCSYSFVNFTIPDIISQILM